MKQRSINRSNLVEFRLADSENSFKNMVEVNLEIHNFISIVNLHGSAELNFKMECPIFGCEHKKNWHKIPTITRTWPILKNFLFLIIT